MGADLLSDIRQDWWRCGPTARARVREVIHNPAMWAVFVYRFRRWVAETFPRPVRWLFAPLTGPLGVGVGLLTHVQLDTSARVGPGLYLPHLGTVVIGPGSVVGRNCTIAHCVTVGRRGGPPAGPEDGVPVIGDRVYIGPGAAIVGPVSVGDDSLISAGAVVIKSIPVRSVVGGSPGRVLSREGSFDLIEYRGMESDPARVAALAAATGPPPAATVGQTAPERAVK